MKWFRNLSIGKKLSLGFAFCLGVAVIIGGYSVKSMASMNTTSKALVSDSVDGLATMAQFSGQSRQFRVVQFRRALAKTDAERSSIEEENLGYKKGADEALAAYGKTVTAADDKANFVELEKDWTSVKQMDAEILGRSRVKNSEATIVALSGPIKVAFLDVAKEIDTIIGWNESHATKMQKEMEASAATTRNLTILLLAIGVVLGAGMAITITKFIVSNVGLLSGRLETLQTVCVRNLENALEAMEHGDLTVKVETGTTPLPTDTHEEFGKVATIFNTLLSQVQNAAGAFNRSQQSLSQLVRQLQGAAAKVSSSSTQLAGTAAEVEASANEIGSTMREISSASEQAARGAGEVAAGNATQAQAVASGAEMLKTLTEAVHGVAGDAADAAKAVGNADEVASSGAEIVSQSVQGMNGILKTVTDTAEVIQTLGESSQKIGMIVQTIEEIAEQTNLLALNAAIEAARAGDAGRGFAVVADEVRKLAERSSGATREIGSLISEIQTRTSQAVTAIESGTKGVQTQATLAEKTGSALSEIQEAFEAVTQRVKRISVAAESMTASSDQVQRSISEVAAVVEEASAASEELSASADEVSASVTTVSSSTQQQAAAVRDLVSASEALANVAQDLQAQVSQFKIDAATTGETIYLRAA